MSTKVGLIAIFAFSFYILTYRVLGLPSNEELIILARQLYTSDGYLVAVAGSFLEALLLLGLYLPGSGVVILGAVFSSEGLLDARVFTLMAIMGFLSAYVVNYLLGRFGWYRLLVRFGLGDQVEKTAKRLEGAGLLRRIWLCSMSYFHPNTAALWATAAGVLGIRFGEFFLASLVATTLWTSVWTALAYWLGPVILKVLTSWLVVPIMLLFLILISIDPRNLIMCRGRSRK